MNKRFRDTGISIGSFLNEVFVECPRCKSRAVILPNDSAQEFLSPPRRLICNACAHVQEWNSVGVMRSDGLNDLVDPWFRRPLWLQIPCCGEVLWALNQKHLDFLEQLLRAKLRERKPHKEYGWGNATLLSRLPRWIKAAKNREEVLKAARKLRAKL